MTASRYSILMMIAAVALWAAVDALALFLSQAYSPFQVVWTRYGVHLAFMLLLWGWREPRSLVATRRPVFQIARSLLMLVMPMAYILGVSRGMDGGTLLAIFWIAPLLLLSFAVVFLRERVSSLTWIAGAISAVGAALLCNPGALPSLRSLVWPLSMTVAFCLYIVMTRSLRTESPRANLFYTALGVFVSVCPLMPFVWVKPTLHDFAVMAAIGLLGCASLYCLDRLTDAGPVSDSAPVSGTQVIFTLGTAAAVGQLHPTPELWTGLGLVAAAVMLMWWRIPRFERPADGMNERRNLLQESLAAIERLQGRLDASERALRQPIAIVGAGCRYPGGIETPDALWRVVRDGIDAVTEIPADRWDVDAYYDPDPKAAGKMVSRRGGFLSQVDRFDPRYFGISPREATTLDPQQRLLLETASEALESAGLAAERLAGSLTGVFVGITTSDYGQLLRQGGPENSDVYSATGSALNAAAGRLSFTFGFQGPCVAVDTACSSSLVAVHLACQSLRTGESNLALAGGVNVVLAPDAMVLFSRWGMMAPDGACKTFDAAADGFVRAEGCAVIALKRLADAVAAGDPILAVIRGSAVNSDGRSSGLTVPNGPAQEAVLRAALANADLKPADIDYVEAHGTGTSLGDPIEVEALGAVMRQGRRADRPLAIGSIKTNLGHTEAASGVAGLLKVVQALRHEAIPPHLHFTRPSPAIPWANLPITVPTKLTPWPRGEVKRRAGVSSFGFSGTNAHVILEEAPAFASAVTVASVADAIVNPGGVATDVAADVSHPAIAGPYLVPLSARDDTAVREVAVRVAEFLRSTPAAALADVVTTLATGRSHQSRRLAVIADSIEDLQLNLRAIAAGQQGVTIADGNVRAGQQPKIAFLFTGQGAQYAGMGRCLYDTEPVFRAQIDRAAVVLAPLLERPLLEVLFPVDEADTTLTQTGYTQPALFAFEYALVELWRSWGINPSIVAGHSVGEYVAACVAGVFSFADGLLLIAERARLMQALPAGGGMAAVFADEKQVAARILSAGGRLSIAALNGPEETVVAGDSEALAKLVEQFTGLGIQSKVLDVSHAFHSARLDPMLDAFERRAAAIQHGLPRVSLLSNLTGAPFPAGTGPDARYWRRHAREPVRFAACIESLRTAGVTVLLEVGPHPTLLALAARAAPQATWSTAASVRRGRDERREMLASLGVLYARGAVVRWDAVVAGQRGRRIPLPTYPFQRERYWVSTPSQQAGTAAEQGHPLLGQRHELASAAGTYLWERDISLESHPWLVDHRVQGVAIVPATAYIEMAAAAGIDVLGKGSLGVREIENLKPIILHEGMAHRVQATLVVEADGSARFAVHGRRVVAGASASPAVPWVRHMTARLSRVDAPEAAPASLAAFEDLKRRAHGALSGAEFYAQLARKGNQWGACFQGMQQVWSAAGEALGRVRVPESLVGEMSRYRFHPAVSDSCGHALVATVSLEAREGATGGAFVGGGVGEVRFHRSPTGQALWAHARLRRRSESDGNVVIGDVWVYDESGALVSETLEARLWYLENDASNPAAGAPMARMHSTGAPGPDGVPADWLYEVRWQQQVLSGESRRAPKSGPWLVFADRGGLGERIANARHAAGLETVLVSKGAQWAPDGNRVTLREAEADDYRKLMTFAGSPAAVLHLWSLDSADANARERAGGGAYAGVGVGASASKDARACGGRADVGAGAGAGTGASARTGALTDTAQRGLTSGLESAVLLLHAVQGAGSAVRPRIWLVTAGAQAVSASDRCEAPWNAALWGFGKALSAESAELWGGLIDVTVAEATAVTGAAGAAGAIGATAAMAVTAATEATAATVATAATETTETTGATVAIRATAASETTAFLAKQVIREIEAATIEDKVAFRGQERYVPRLERRVPSALRTDFVADPDGTYLVTGGLGGVGLAMARWLAEQGAGHLLLLGRTPLPARERWDQLDSESAVGRRTEAVAAIEALGVEVDMRTIDVADGDALQQCIESRHGAGKPPVRGVIHAAGVLQFEALESQTVASLRAGLAAKVGGAWHLHRLLADQPLDCFVLCSSTSTLLNSPLLGGYAAGNSFLDALAHHRRASGLSGLSVNWGTWGEVGMAAEAQRSAGREMLSGVDTISTARGLAALRELLDTQAVQTAVMPIDWNEFARAYPAFAADAFLQSQVTVLPTGNGAANSAGALTSSGLRALEAGPRTEALQVYLRAEAARVLGFTPERLDCTEPLSSFGFDSLMAVQLKNRIEADLGIVVPMIQFLQGPSVDQLVPALLERAAGAAETTETNTGESVETWDVGSL